MTAGDDCRLVSTMGRVELIQLLLWGCCLISWVANQQFVNVATGKTYTQISTYYDQGPSSNAANGNTSGHYPSVNNCIHTNARGNNSYPVPHNTYHWWEVDLGGTYPVYDITVWGRNLWLSRLYPFTITVDGQTCVSVTSVLRTRNNSVRCTSVMFGRVVRLTLDRTDQMLNLCEFQIFVCREGFYGLDCSSRCDTNCDGRCNRTSGYCTLCREGFYGLDCSSRCNANCEGGCNRTRGYCTQCKDGYYKQTARPCIQCPGTCDNNTPCNKTTGHCDECPPGKKGNTCNQACDGGQYGPSRCSMYCGQCEDGQQCHPVTGHCPRCQPGFYPPLCVEDCREGFYGLDCSSACDTNCDGGCNRTSGHCTQCRDRYYKQTAATCIQCPGTCDNNTPCDKTTGHCEKCPTGKKGNTCNQACDGGQYGPSRCSLSCGQCEDGQQCHTVTGHCPRCQPGFYPPLCVEACENKTHGENCRERCGQCKGGQPCNTATGSCTTGCEPGYTGELCNDTCDEGLYGAECNETCGHCQVNTTCHHQHGQCLVGCAPGFTGNLCVKLDQEKWSWVITVVGSTIGAAMLTIGLVAVVCWCRRSRDNQNRITPPAEDVKKQENNYDSPHPNSKTDPDREVYMELALFPSEVTTSSNKAD